MSISIRTYLLMMTIGSCTLAGCDNNTEGAFGSGSSAQDSSGVYRPDVGGEFGAIDLTLDGGAANHTDTSSPSTPKPIPKDPIITPPKTHKVKLSWQRPFERVNGESLSVSDIPKYILHFKGPSGGGWQRIAITDFITSGDNASRSLLYSRQGLYQVKLQAVDKEGLTSSPSEPLCWFINDAYQLSKVGACP